MSKKLYSFFILLTAFLWLGSGTMWGTETISPESPYTNNFDSETLYGIPSGWTKVAGTNYYPSVDSKSNIPTRSSSARGLVFQGYSSDGQMVLALPEFSDDIKYLTLEFYYKSKGSSYPATMSVGYTTSLTDKTQYHSVQSIGYYTDGFTRVTVDYSAVTPAIADGAYIAFSFAGTGTSSKKGALYIDDVTVTTSYVAPTGGCAKPKNLTKSDDTPEGATFTWEQNTEETTYQWACVASGAEVTEWNTLDENVRTKTITGLTAGTAYDFHVRSYCGAGEGEQSASAKSTFTPTCPAPTAPQVTDITTTTATLSWTAAAGISNYQYIVVARDAAEDWTSPTLVEGATTASLTSGLAAGTKYDVYVRSYYNATTVSASVKAQFQTPCNAMAIADFDGTFETETAGSGLMPNCWDAAATYDYSDYYSSTTTTYPCVKETYSSKTGDKCLAFYGGSTPNIAVLPVFTEALNTLTISFYYKNGSTWGGYFSFGYYKNGVFTAYEGASNLERLTSYTQFELAIPNVAAAEGARLAIKYTGSSYNYDAYIDDITISLTPSCTKPSGVTVSNVVYNGATIDWTENGSATEWKVQYSTNNTDWTTANGGENIISHPYNLRGLTSGTPYYVRVISVCGPTEESPAVAAASTFTPQCVTPGIPTIPAKTTTTATIQWTVNSGEAEWNLQYKKSSDADWTTVADVTENPYLLEGLTSGSTYQVRVAATCNGTYTSAATFDTECEAKSAPFDEDFNDLTALPACWNFAGSTSTMNVSTGYSWLSLENKALFFSGSGGAYAYAILPTMNVEWNTLQIAFSHREESGSSGNIELGYYASGAFTALTSYSNKGDNMQAETAYSLAAIPDGARAAFAYKPASSGYAAAIDDIHVSVYVAPSCAEPTVVTASSVTNSSASISWTNGGEEAQWSLRYSKNSDMSEATLVENITAKPHTLTGLDPDATYYVQVKAVCGGTDGESDWSTAIDFTTDCNPVELADFAKQEFGSSVPSCWRFTKNSNEGYNWTPSNSYKVSASYSMDYYAPTAVENYADMTTPSIILTEDANLKFQLRNYYYGSEATGEVYIVTSTATTKLLDFPVTTSSFALQTIDLSTYTGQTVKFIFRGHGAGSGTYAHIFIDDVEVAAKPCDAPTALQKVESSSSVVLSWTDDAASKWNLRWRETGASDWNEANNLTAKNLTLAVADGLALGKTYEAQVQAVCTATKSSDWSGLISFGLVCGAAPTSLTVSARTAEGATLNWDGAEDAFLLQTSQDNDTWSDAIPVNAKTYTLTGLNAGMTYYARVQNACGGDFATTSFKTWCGLQDAAELPLNVTSFSNPLPACWEVTFKGEWSGISGNKICFYGTEEQWVVLPAYDIDLNKLSVTFTFTTSSATATFGYLDAPNGEFHAFASQPTSGVELDLAAEASAPKYIAVRYNGGSSDYNNVTISRIFIRKTPTCLKPTGVAGTPGVGSASINWINGGSEEAWNIQYKLASVASWDGAAQVAASTKPFELSGLEQGVTYKVRVQAACVGEDPSDWSDEAEFTTECADIASIPWDADFSTNLSNCWTIHCESPGYYSPTVYDGLQIPGGNAGHSNVVVLPGFTPSLTPYTITLRYKCDNGAGNATPQIGYVTAKDEKETFVVLTDGVNEIGTLEKSSGFKTVYLPLSALPAEASNLAIRYAGGSSEGDLIINEFRVSHVEIFEDLEDSENETRLKGLKSAGQLDFVMARPILSDGDYNTICLPFNMSASQLADDKCPLNGFEVRKYDHANVDLSLDLVDLFLKTVSEIEAGTAYFIRNLGATKDIQYYADFRDVTISASAVANPTSDATGILFKGAFDPFELERGNAKNLYLSTGSLLYYPDVDFKVKGFRGYVLVDEGGSALPAIRRGAKVRISEPQDAPTGVDKVQNDNVQCTKVLDGTQVIIIRNGVKYTIQGQKIQ